jgi:hypothetical protein
MFQHYYVTLSSTHTMTQYLTGHHNASIDIQNVCTYGHHT